MRAERPFAFTATLTTALVAATLTLAPAPARAVSPPDALTTPFYQGRTRVGLSGGGIGHSGNLDFYISGSFGYFVLDNLELGVDLSLWFGDTPFTAQLGPAVRYILPLDSPVQPYIGAFYRHWFVSGADPDADTVGARLGVLIHSQSIWFTLGLAYEAVVSQCSGDCSSIYPEFGLSFVF